MAEKKQTIFREEALRRISSPEKLTDYLRVTNPGIWVVLVAVILLLVGVIAWASVGTLETKADAKVFVEDHTAEVILEGAQSIRVGMPLRITSQDSQEYSIAYVKEDEYGRTVGVADISLPDGTYDGEVVVDSMRPIDFLLESR
ncbi:MAG: hypothetical protein IJX90_07095 [Blautia sp.]|nr:hypothetical protein [Blautia sp.]